MKVAYLAAPYTHKDANVRTVRFHSVNHAAAYLIKLGLHVFSPVSHTHPIAVQGDLPRGWDYWQAFDERMIQACDLLIVLTLDGWQQSIGIRYEIAIARDYNLPIRSLSMEQVKCNQIYS